MLPRHAIIPVLAGLFACQSAPHESCELARVGAVTIRREHAIRAQKLQTMAAGVPHSERLVVDAAVAELLAHPDTRELNVDAALVTYRAFLDSVKLELGGTPKNWIHAAADRLGRAKEELGYVVGECATGLR